MSEIDEEIDMMLSLYADVCERDESRKYALLVHLALRFELQIIVPSNGYPEETYPQLYVLSGPNAQLVSSFSTELNRRIREEVPLGFPLLMSVIGIAQSLAEEVKEKNKKELVEEQQRLEAEKATILQDLREMQECGIEVACSDAIVDRRSKFVAHMAPAHNQREIDLVINFLRSQRSIAAAAHPAIYAYRYTDENGILQKNNDDDGEHGAAGRIAFLMDQLEVDGYIVVVTRWFGGILLGPDRFKHIMEVAKNLLLTIPDKSASDEKQQKGGRRGKVEQ